MTDPPKPPRPRTEAFPPPLPGAYTEPFPLARDPEFRMRSTPPSGSLLLNREVEQLSAEDQRDQIIRELRQTLVLLREKTAAQAVAPEVSTRSTPAPVSLRTMTKRELAKVGGKWTLLLALLPIAGAFVAKKWPAYKDLVDFALSWLP